MLSIYMFLGSRLCYVFNELHCLKEQMNKQMDECNSRVLQRI